MVEKCSYCETEMVARMCSVKREVPTGARDLDLYDEVPKWLCPKCNSAGESGFRKCKNCGSYAVDAAHVEQAPGFQIAIGDRGCSNCWACVCCGRTIGHEPYSHYHSHADVDGVAHQSCKENDERQRAQKRIKEGKCVRCGKPLGFVEKRLGGRIDHVNCPFDPAA